MSTFLLVSFPSKRRKCNFEFFAIVVVIFSKHSFDKLHDSKFKSRKLPFASINSFNCWECTDLFNEFIDRSKVNNPDSSSFSSSFIHAITHNFFRMTSTACGTNALSLKIKVSKHESLCSSNPFSPHNSLQNSYPPPMLFLDKSNATKHGFSQQILIKAAAPLSPNLLPLKSNQRNTPVCKPSNSFKLIAGNGVIAIASPSVPPLTAAFGENGDIGFSLLLPPLLRLLRTNGSVGDDLPPSLFWTWLPSFVTVFGADSTGFGLTVITCFPICMFISGKSGSCGLFELLFVLLKRFCNEELCLKTFKNGCISFNVKLLLRMASPATFDLASGTMIFFKSSGESELSKVIQPMKGGRFDISDTS